MSPREVPRETLDRIAHRSGLSPKEAHTVSRQVAAGRDVDEAIQAVWDAPDGERGERNRPARGAPDHGERRGSIEMEVRTYSSAEEYARDVPVRAREGWLPQTQSQGTVGIRWGWVLLWVLLFFPVVAYELWRGTRPLINVTWVREERPSPGTGG